MHKTQRKPRRRRQFEGRERGEIGFVPTLAWHRHMHEIERPLEPRQNRVRQVDHDAHVAWLEQMLVSEIAIAKMQQAIDVSRYGIAEPGNGGAEFSFQVGDVADPIAKALIRAAPTAPL